MSRAETRSFRARFLRPRTSSGGPESASTPPPPAAPAAPLGVRAVVPDGFRTPRSVARTPPACVLVIASDRRFRTVAATLLTRHGYDVAVGGHGEDITEVARRERADVVVIDASASLTVAAREAARLGLLRPRVRVVAVSDGDGVGLAALPVLPKWSSFDQVFEAIERARADEERGGLSYVSP